jgi:hypothetical protein
MEEECMICFEEKSDFVIFSCKHKVCVICYPKIPRRCPLCNIDLPNVTIPINLPNLIQRPVNLQIPCFIMMILFSIASFIEYVYRN